MMTMVNISHPSNWYKVHGSDSPLIFHPLCSSSRSGWSPWPRQGGRPSGPSTDHAVGTHTGPGTHQQAPLRPDVAAAARAASCETRMCRRGLLPEGPRGPAHWKDAVWYVQVQLEPEINERTQVRKCAGNKACRIGGSLNALINKSHNAPVPRD